MWVGEVGKKNRLGLRGRARGAVTGRSTEGSCYCGHAIALGRNLDVKRGAGPKSRFHMGMASQVKGIGPGEQVCVFMCGWRGGCKRKRERKIAKEVLERTRG